MADTYVLVHGAWHTGELMEPVAQHLRAKGHTVHCPTLAGNRPGDDRATTGLAEAAASLVDYLNQRDLKDVRLMGHSYGGMVISHAADQVGHRIRRLVYWNAFVPLDGESLNDLVPPHYVALFDGIAAANHGAVMLLERAGVGRALSAGPRWLAHVYFFVAVNVTVQPRSARLVSVLPLMRSVALLPLKMSADAGSPSCSPALMARVPALMVVGPE